jgi:hypothetical protein
LTGLQYLRRAGDLFDHGLTLNLHAYQCHVFLDWHELHSTTEKPWDRLADWLNGRGVSSLDEELVNLELQPVHEALRSFLDPALVRRFADIADRGTQPVGGSRAAGAERAQKIERQRNDFVKEARPRAEGLLQVARDAYAARLKQAGEPAPGTELADPALQAQAFTRLLRAAMHMPAVEAIFPAPWTAAARRMLPSPSPQLTATEMWGPVLAWCVLEWLAESMTAAQPATARAGAAQPDAAQPERIALDLFDRLRLREPFGHAFAALGFKGEEAWRAAARIKVLLLTGAGAGEPQETPTAAEAGAPGLASETWEAKMPAAAERGLSLPKNRAAETGEAMTVSVAVPGPDSDAGEGKSAVPTPQPEQEQVALSPVLWLDPDVRWLCGVHEAEGHFYLVRELYEELLWWLLMPALLRLAGEPAPSRAAVKELSKTVATALSSAEAAGYRINTLLGSLAASETVVSDETAESPALESEPPELTPPAASAPDAET